VRKRESTRSLKDYSLFSIISTPIHERERERKIGRRKKLNKKVKERERERES